LYIDYGHDPHPEIALEGFFRRMQVVVATERFLTISKEMI
jgi:hypothetical protein